MIGENNILKEFISKLESDKSKLKSRIKELSEENVLLHRRHQDNSTIVSDREDSPNLLSELDKQEELLNSISKKNKHIKRLLRDIETLETDTDNQKQHIQKLENTLREATQNVTTITNQLDEQKLKISEQDDVICELNLSVKNLVDQLGVMESERSERELEIQEFGARLEERAVRWRQLLQEKDDRLDSLRAKYEVVLEKNPGYDIDADRVGLQRLAEALEARDLIIVDLESKIFDLSEEMIGTTELLNRLSKERESRSGGNLSPINTKTLCPMCEDMKTKVNLFAARCEDLQELVKNLEDDNVLKSIKALEAQKLLASFKSGEEGLTHAIETNLKLQTKIDSRDKHVRSLISELNILQQTAQENAILR